MKKQTKNTSKQTKAMAELIPLTGSLIKWKHDENGVLSLIEFTPRAYVDYVDHYFTQLRYKKAVVDVRNELKLCTFTKDWAQLDLDSYWTFNDALIIRNAMNVYFSLPCNRERALLIPLLDELVDRYISNVLFDEEVAA